MTQKPSIPKGTRDFSPKEMIRRNYIFDTIKQVFLAFGYQPIETPAMENLSTLTGKYGEEGDKLLFKVLNSGDFLSKVADKNLFADSGKLSFSICEKGLRYDLTVPFARFVVQHRNDITFPFKRYQIQPVWRGDRPAKGRYREFYQCDVDVIGSNSLLNEVELIQIIDKVFNKLDLDVTIKLNNRKILSGLAEVIGEAERFMDITIAIDKLDKIGVEGVTRELKEKNVTDSAINKLRPVLELTGTNEEKLTELKNILSDSETGLKGIDEVESVFSFLNSLSVNSDIELDLTLARGLNYYTGAIFEVKAKELEFGSIVGGGRYDDLTGVFGLNDVSGVGISFGADRIYDVLMQLDKFPIDSLQGTKLMFVNFGEKESAYCLNLLALIRDSGINAELYPDSAKMKKQMTYANNKGVQFVALIGEEEMKNNIITLKNMETGDQSKITIDELITKLGDY